MGLGMVAITTLAFVMSKVGFTGKIPDVIVYANVAAAVVELGLVLGLMKGHRAPWAFGLSLEGTVTLMNLFALPQMARIGAEGYGSIGLCLARGCAAVFLAVVASELPSQRTADG